MKTITLINPATKQSVQITENEALKRWDDCVLTFCDHDEQYFTEGLSGIESIAAVIKETGINRASQIWFG